MNRFDRQTRIDGWNQDQLAQACVAVYGRGWLGTFTVWSLASLGIGRILWLGEPVASTQRMADHFLAAPSPFLDVAITEYPFRVEYGDELAWAMGGQSPMVFVGCAEEEYEQHECQVFAKQAGLRWFAGGAGAGGWFGTGAIPDGCLAPSQPIVAMIVAALLTDAVRETICPLVGRAIPEDGLLTFDCRVRSRIDTALLVGIGGIGAYAATALAACGVALELCDHDTVVLTNLNRQGLYTTQDADAGTPKAVAAEQVLKQWFPRAKITSEVRQVKDDYFDLFSGKSDHPDLILSAVDNARTRLVLQSLGQYASLPVIQAGTDLYAADCFVQVPGGPTLDAQMHGALTRAAHKEAQPRRPGGCAGDPSYVVPGMLAGGLIAYRAVHGGHTPIRWRSGYIPVEERTTNDGFYHDALPLETR
jgi:tRNA A37 threonylcarbamoyladenosine dehydratase